LWPKAAIIGIRPERQLSGDNLPRPSTGIVGNIVPPAAM